MGRRSRDDLGARKLAVLRAARPLDGHSGSREGTATVGRGPARRSLGKSNLQPPSLTISRERSERR